MRLRQAAQNKFKTNLNYIASLSRKEKVKELSFLFFPMEIVFLYEIMVIVEDILHFFP